MSNMSHELRTPLNAIMGFNSILKGEEKDIEKIKMFNMIEESASKLLNLVNELLDFEKLESENFEVNNIKFNFLELSYELVKIFNKNKKEKEMGTKISILLKVLV